MIEKPKLDSLDLGEARIRILKTMDGQYSLHGQTRWDDLPYWEFYDAWIVTTQAHGIVRWGPLKYRKNAKREHSGIAEIQMLESTLFYSESQAEDYALQRAIELEVKKFKVDIEFGEIGRTDLGTVREWITGQPPKSFGRYEPPMDRLEAKI